MLPYIVCRLIRHPLYRGKLPLTSRGGANLPQEPRSASESTRKTAAAYVPDYAQQEEDRGHYREVGSKNEHLTVWQLWGGNARSCRGARSRAAEPWCLESLCMETLERDRTRTRQRRDYDKEVN
ncbi:unnamed protein product [Ectocarpus fasciculatus]